MNASRARAFLALALTAALAASAADPPGGTLSPDTPQLTYEAGPFIVSDPEFGCADVPEACDDYALTVELPADWATTHPGDSVRVHMTFDLPSADLDLYLLSDTGSVLDQSTGSTGEAETVEIPAGQGTKNYTVQIQSWAGSGATATVTIDLVSPPPPPPDEDGDGIADADDLCPGTPPGTSVDSTGCPLPPGDAESCGPPGLTLLTDASADNVGGAPGTDLLSLQIYQPEQVPPTGDNIADQRIAFRINVDPDATPNSVNSWFASFDSPTGVRGVRMTGDSTGNPVFHLYTPGSSTGGIQDGRFISGASPADPSSSFDAATGAITIVVKVTDLGLTAPGQVLSGFNAGVTATTDPGGVGAGGTSVIDGMPENDLSRSTVDYTLHDNTVCGRPQLKPIGPPEPASGPPPRFYDFQSPVGLADPAGEPSIGYNPATRNAMFIARTEVDRVTFAENGAPIGMVDAAGNALPEACEPLWQDKSYAGAANTLDPILETEVVSGRTFQSSLSGANSIFAFSDDDGESWTPAQAGPPNGGVDHQTLGVGPWAAGAKPPTATEDYAVYYCSQSIAAAFCSRSDNGGISFGPGIAFRDTVTDCNNTVGGLHGHTQVAPDGTVYVPFGNCGAKVANAVSLDSGLTWTVKPVPQSSSGDDPGLGIARDGTAYLCYSEGGGKTFASVSRDRGDTWSGHYDLGAAVGVVNTVFTTMVAGDSDRAACAFLGTTTAGNYQALDFPGIWYPYVATTYDGGETWHTVNVTPTDPVQGAGGICTGGIACGTNRNLLDFNDIIIDEKGRTLFAYADGCRGACVLNPEQNTFSQNGVIARQSGGRTLLAEFDDAPGTQFNSAAPTTPGAACARADLSLRTTALTRVNWTAPDNGGSAIANYKVYRGLAAAGPFDFIGDSGPKTSFLDPTADPDVEFYYYKVEAQNPQGLAPHSNVIELPLSQLVTETSCALPGVTVAAEGAPGACVGTGGGCTPQTDVQSVHVAELPSLPDKIVMTIKVGSLDPAPAPDHYWFAITKTKAGENLYLAMDTTQATPRFTYGTYAGGTVTTFSPTEQGTIDPDSNFEANGYIYLVADKALFGSPLKGEVIPSVEARSRVASAEAPSRDNIGPGDYTLRGVEICAPNTPPVAVLEATPQSGDAPLAVTFDGTGSFDPDTGVPDTIKSYVINFGDGSGDSASDGETPTWTHTYANPGPFSATLRVIDSRDMASDNAAEKVIEVGGGGGTTTTTEAEVGNNRLGGALPLLSLLGLALLAALGRRRR